MNMSIATRLDSLNHRFREHSFGNHWHMLFIPLSNPEYPIKSHKHKPFLPGRQCSKINIQQAQDDHDSTLQTAYLQTQQLWRNTVSVKKSSWNHYWKKGSISRGPMLCAMHICRVFTMWCDIQICFPCCTLFINAMLYAMHNFQLFIWIKLSISYVLCKYPIWAIEKEVSFNVKRHVNRWYWPYMTNVLGLWWLQFPRQHSHYFTW